LAAKVEAREEKKSLNFLVFLNFCLQPPTFNAENYMPPKVAS
jgi:hypothetical protein